MTNLYLVRHAHSTYTPDELERPLSEKGFIDAKKVTELLKEEDIHIAITSPYKRAFQTIEGVAQHFNLPIRIEPELRERLLSPHSVKDFPTAIKKVWENPSFHWKGGESNHVAQQRGVDCILSILEEYEGKNIVIGTHGNIMVLIMNFFDSQYDFAFWKSLQMPDIYKLTFDGKALVSVSRIGE